MAIMHTGSAMEALGRLLTTGTATAVAEAELLERFVSQGDPAAFEVLLQRHGPMVLRVCRRILDDRNDVDDAFQATFLILVKKAASIREREVLGIWLYGVARRVAVRARVKFSVYVANLVDGVMRSMMISKLSCVAGVILAASVSIAGVQTFVVAARARPAAVLEPPRNAVQKNVPVGPPVNKAVHPAEPGSERFVLENGLTVIMRPIKGAESTALVVLYSIGSDHDPAGKSGLGHMVEHLYVTAAAGQASARSAEEFASRYPEGANGQTGDRYTVFGTVFPKNDLESELKDAGARMGDLRLGAGDLARERPRLLVEVGNMFGDFPTLAASNHARELIRPTPGGGRRGGLPAHVNALTLTELQDHWRRYYKPRNAIVVLSGAIDPTAVRKLITANFAQIAPGEELPTPSEPAPPKGLGRILALAVRSPVPEAESTACLAYAAPAPGSDLYAPFLVLVSRLSARAFMLGATGPTGSPVYFTPLDDGAVISISTAPKPGESTTGTFKRLELFVAQTIEPKLGILERLTARRRFGPFLGLVESPDSVLVTNPYGVAFSLGRREQWKLKSADLITACDKVTDDQIRRAAREIFAPDRRARAIIAIEK